MALEKQKVTVIVGSRPALPSQVRIGYRDFALIPITPLAATANDIFGQCDLTLAEIRIRDDLHPVKSANTLLHEILHAAYYIGDVEEGDKQEKVVTVLANMLSQIWRDNPDLIAYLDKSFRR